MRVIRLQAENFQILKAIEITPGDGPVIIGGKNEQGKSSIMDAIWVALSGKSAAPAKPIREGTEKATITLDIGEYVVERTFKSKDGAPYTDTLKLLDDRGRIVPKPQKVLDDLLGAIGFDPFAFTKLKAEDQADQLLGLVPLPIDLEDFAREDAADYATRRDVGRQVEQLNGQIAGIPLVELEGEAPDRDALTEQLANAADHNGAIDRERMQRESRRRAFEGYAPRIASMRERVASLRAEADRIEGEANTAEAEAEAGLKELDELPELEAQIDTQAVRQQLQAAEADLAERARQKRRAELVADRDAAQARYDGFTEDMAERERQRKDALSKAKMPVEGLGFSINEKGKPLVTWQGLPFAQASTAAQIRASTAIAMAANPELRILRIKDGSLLDEDMMAAIVEMAAEDDFQLWIEVVGTGAAGIIIEDGTIKGSGDQKPAAEEKPKTSKAAKQGASDAPQGGLL